MTESRGDYYYDDRLFVLSLSRGRHREDAERLVDTSIFHEVADADLTWCVATYRNCARFPLVGVYHFDSRIDASRYLSLVEPTVPLVSVRGREPERPLPYSDFLIWKQTNAMRDYDYKETFRPGGSNPREVVVQTKEQFLKAHDEAKRRLSNATASSVGERKIDESASPTPIPLVQPSRTL